MSTRKKFDPSLFANNDQRARAAVLRYMDSVGSYCIENDDKYGPDLVLYSGLSPSCYIEVEIKSAFQGPNFQFPTVQLPARKGKFLRLGLDVEFWILNKTCDHAIIIPGHVLDSSFLVEVANKYIAQGEMFWQVPVEECIILELQNEEK